MTGTCPLNTSGFWKSTVTTQPKCRDKNVKPSHWSTISNDDNFGMFLDVINYNEMFNECSKFISNYEIVEVYYGS